MKPLRFEHLLRLDEDAIKERYPEGAVMNGSGRWIPGEVHIEATGRRTLKDLLKAKKQRQEKARLLHRNPSAVGEKRAADADEEEGYTDVPHLAMSPDAGEAVDRETQSGFDADAEAKSNSEHIEQIMDMRGRVLGERFARLQRQGMKYGVDLTPKLEALLKEANREIEVKRRAA